MIDKTNTIFVDKYEYEKTNDLLNEILRRLETFNRFNGYTPENVQLNVNQYYEIMEYRPELIKKIDTSYYTILNMKVVF